MTLKSDPSAHLAKVEEPARFPTSQWKAISARLRYLGGAKAIVFVAS